MNDFRDELANAERKAIADHRRGTRVDRKAAAVHLHDWLTARAGDGEAWAAIVLASATIDGLAKRVGDRVKAEKVTIPVPTGPVSMPAAYADGTGQLTLWLWLGPDDLDDLINAMRRQAETLGARAGALAHVRRLIDEHQAANGYEALVAEGLNPEQFAEAVA